MRLFPFVLLVACGATDPEPAAPAPDEPEPNATPAPLNPGARFECVPDRARSTNSTEPCTEIGCVSGTRVRFPGEPTGGWVSGEYVFEVTSEDRVTRCTTRLPFAGCAPDLVTCDAGLTLEASGCALPAEEQALGDLFIEDCPTQVAVRVTRDGEEIASGALQMSFHTSQPNGEGCAPVCVQAEGELGWGG